MRISDWSSDVCSSDLIFLCGLHGPSDPEDRIGRSRREVSSSVGRTCLEKHWMPLFRTRNVERSVYAEELVFVHQCMHFRFIEKDAAFLVMDECVVFPAVPKPSHRGNIDRKSVV